MINLIINNSPQSFENGSDLSQILKQLTLESKEGIAIALNDKVIPKQKWNKTVLNEKDHLTIIKAVQGG